MFGIIKGTKTKLKRLNGGLEVESGTIRSINFSRGYGFITKEGKDGKNKENNVFFHRSNVVDPSFDDLELNDKVDYTLTETDKGAAAVNVVAYQK